jgi:hypothetical protein
MAVLGAGAEKEELFIGWFADALVPAPAAEAGAEDVVLLWGILRRLRRDLYGIDTASYFALG